MSSITRQNFIVNQENSNIVGKNEKTFLLSLYFKRVTELFTQFITYYQITKNHIMMQGLIPFPLPSQF